ncbi:MAG: SDR family oxidoreductase [Acidobacteriota bacterium]
MTGASAGIGRAFAELLAERGYDLVITARRRDRLDAVAEVLSSRGVSVLVEPADLADPAAPGRLADWVRDRGLHIDVLINNAGYGVPGSYVKSTWEVHADFLRVMVVAVSELTHRLLPGMIERRWGRILNVASLAAFIPPSAGHTLYAASKAYLVRFSEALALEVGQHGVHVTAVCPGFTLSEFHDVTGTRGQVSQLPAYMWMDAASVAREGYDAVMAGSPVHVTGAVNRTLATLARVLPQQLVRAIVRRNASKFRKT